MKEIGVSRFLESLNLSDSVNDAQIPELRTINLRSNGNYSIDFRSDRITFDKEHELIKIKKYNYKATNGILSMPVKNGKEIHFRQALTYMGFRFRTPRVGDIVFFVKKSNGNLGATTAVIEELYTDHIVMNKTISYDLSNYTVGYADPTLFQNSSQDTLVPELFLYYQPKTTLSADVYIDYFAVTSFSARSEYFG